LNLKNKEIRDDTVNICIKKVTKDNFKEIENLWLSLESNSGPCFFLSWKWISTWFNQLKKTHKSFLLTAVQNNTVVGLGIFVERNNIRHKLLKSRQWLLHRTGDEALDQIWIENNDFLIRKENRAEISHAIWQHLTKEQNQVDEFVINLVNKTTFNKIDNQINKFSFIQSHHDFGYRVSLHNHENAASYMISLSKNSRNQIKRSNKLLAKYGEITFNVIFNRESQLELLNEAQQWHTDKWENTATASGFTNTNFVNFHKNLILSSSTSAQTFVAKLTVNGELFGCLYCFVQNKSVYYYLSCLKPMKDNKIKLGLMMHTLLIEWLILNKNEYTDYDFLAGDVRYKRSLSSDKDEYAQVIIQKNVLKFKIENAAILLKRRIKHTFKKLQKTIN